MCKGLILETSTHKSIVAFIDHSQLTRTFFIEKRSHLSNEIFQIFQTMSLSIDQLSFIGVGIGPGSYTGVRIATTIAKAFSYTQNIPLIPFCSLQGFTPSFEGPYLSMLDAKSDGVYTLKAHQTKGHIIFEKPCVLSIEKASDLIQKVPTVCSNEIFSLQKKFPQVQVNWIESDLDIKFLTNLCLMEWEKKNFIDQTNLEPLYLRGS